MRGSVRKRLNNLASGVCEMKSLPSQTRYAVKNMQTKTQFVWVGSSVTPQKVQYKTATVYMTHGQRKVLKVLKTEYKKFKSKPQ